MLLMNKKSEYYDNQLLPFEEFKETPIETLKELLQPYYDEEFSSTILYTINNIDAISMFMDFISKEDVDINIPISDIYEVYTYISNLWHNTKYVGFISLKLELEKYTDKVLMRYFYLEFDNYIISEKLFNSHNSQIAALSSIFDTIVNYPKLFIVF